MTNNPNPTGDKPVVTQGGPFHVSRSTDGKNYWFSARDAASGVSIPAKSKTDAELLVRSINVACTLFAARYREQETLSREGREAPLGLEWTEDGYSLRTPYDGDVDADGRHIIVGGEIAVTFADSDEGEKAREAFIAALSPPASEGRDVGREASILWERNVLATIIVELLNMVPTVRSRAGDMIIRRARQAIDGLPDAIAQGEANYRAYRLALREAEKPDGTLESLATVATMLEEYGIKELPANEQGKIDFMRAIMESAVDEIRAFLSTPPASPEQADANDL